MICRFVSTEVGGYNDTLGWRPEGRVEVAESRVIEVTLRAQLLPEKNVAVAPWLTDDRLGEKAVVNSATSPRPNEL